MAKIIDGIRVSISFGHYEETEDNDLGAYLHTDFRYTSEVTSSHGCVSAELASFKDEVVRQVGAAFGKFILDHGAE